MGGSVANEGQVLLVEDDAAIRQVLCLGLEDEGIPVVTADDGLAAVAWLRDHLPDLVLLDMNLPGLSGSQVAQHLQAEHGRKVPIVVMTADGRAARKAHEVGAIAYFPKPFDLNELLSTIQRILEHRWQ